MVLTWNYRGTVEDHVVHQKVLWVRVAWKDAEGDALRQSKMWVRAVDLWTEDVFNEHCERWEKMGEKFLRANHYMPEDETKDDDVKVIWVGPKDPKDKGPWFCVCGILP